MHAMGMPHALSFEDDAALGRGLTRVALLAPSLERTRVAVGWVVVRGSAGRAALGCVFRAGCMFRAG